uniref:Uncharacterized protein n=1 Tax=Xiphophorus maculatus TaxID=8083 RepID=A0A3B5PV15_XIPMA
LVAEQELRPEALQLRFLRLCHPVQDGVFFPFEHLQFDLVLPCGLFLHFLEGVGL